MNSKNLILPMAAVAAASGLYGAGSAPAVTIPADQQPVLVQKLADTFHMDKVKALGLFVQNQPELQKQHEIKYDRHLKRAVAEGKLTQAQKDAIAAEHAKLMDKIAAAKGKDATTRKVVMENVIQEANDWCNKNHVGAHWLMDLDGIVDGQTPAPAPAPRA